MMRLSYAVVLVVLCFVVLTAANYPLNPRVVDQQYREITVQWDAITNFNASGKATQLQYQIQYFLPNRPSYVVPQPYYISYRPTPNITLSNLFTNTLISFQIGVRDTQQIASEFSPYVNFTTKSISDVGDIELPDKVRDITIISYAKGDGMAHKIQWKNPLNLIPSANAKVLSVQYRLEVCNYNPILKNNSRCSVIGQVVSNIKIVVQNSLQGAATTFPLKILYLPTDRDIAVVITPIALNMKEGPSETFINRLNKESKPAAPTNLRMVSSTKNSINIAWDAVIDNTDLVFIIEFSETGKVHQNTRKLVGMTRSNTLTSLSNGISYDVRVAISDSKYGASSFSSILTVTTGDKPAPIPTKSVTTTTPSNISTSTNLTTTTTPSSSFRLLSSSFIVSFIILLVLFAHM